MIRTEYFKKHKIFQNLVPASTGVGMKNTSGSAITANMIAIRPKNDNVNVHIVNSPLQCPAPDYDSSFSRAVEVEYPDYSTIYISGTASIEPGGATAHINDTAGQIDLTMQVIHAILKSRGMDWCDISRSIAYFRNIDEASLLEEYCRKNSLPALPVAIAHANICRDDLLFELEADATREK